ncbi:hypothetical protein ACFLX5_06560, partial [Chloroflexota bacterium]
MAARHLDDIAARLARIRDEYGAEAVAFNEGGENNGSPIYRFRFRNLFGSPTSASSIQICYGVGTTLSLIHFGGV